MFKLVLEKAEEPEIKLPTSTGSSKKQQFQKNIYFFFIDYTKGFGIVNKAEVDVFLELSYFFDDPVDVGNLISGSSSLSKSSLNICKLYHLLNVSVSKNSLFSPLLFFLNHCTC